MQRFGKHSGSCSNSVGASGSRQRPSPSSRYNHAAPAYCACGARLLRVEAGTVLYSASLEPEGRLSAHRLPASQRHSPPGQPTGAALRQPTSAFLVQHGSLPPSHHHSSSSYQPGGVRWGQGTHLPMSPPPATLQPHQHWAPRDPGSRAPPRHTASHTGSQSRSNSGRAGHDHQDHGLGAHRRWDTGGGGSNRGRRDAPPPHGSYSGAGAHQGGPMGSRELLRLITSQQHLTELLDLCETQLGHQARWRRQQQEQQQQPRQEQQQQQHTGELQGWGHGGGLRTGVEAPLNHIHLDAALSRMARLAPAADEDGAGRGGSSSRSYPGRGSFEGRMGTSRRTGDSRRTGASGPASVVPRLRAVVSRLLDEVLMQPAPPRQQRNGDPHDPQQRQQSQQEERQEWDPPPLHATLSARDCASLLGSLARLHPAVRPPVGAVEALQRRLLQLLRRPPASPASSSAARASLNPGARDLAGGGRVGGGGKREGGGVAVCLRDCVQLLHASAKLRAPLPGGRAAVAAVVAATEGQLEGGKPQDVSMLLWALATLGHTPPPRLLQRVAALTTQRLSEQKQQQQQQQDHTHRQWGRAYEPGATQGTFAGSGYGPLHLRAFSAQALANTAWAFARLGHHPGEGWMAEAAAASLPLLQACHTQELANLLWAFATLRHRPPARWLAAAAQHLHMRAATLCAQDVSNAVWSLAVLRVRPGVPLLQRLALRALEVRRELTPQGLANTLTGLAALRVQLPGRVVELLLRGALGPRTLAEAAPPPALGPGAGPVELEAAGPVVAVPNARGMGTQSPPGDKERQLQQRPVPGVTPGELASVALALSRCGHVPSGRWAGRFLAAAARQMGSFGARDLSTLLYSLARLGLRPERPWVDRALGRAAELAESDMGLAEADMAPRHWDQAAGAGPGRVAWAAALGVGAAGGGPLWDGDWAAGTVLLPSAQSCTIGEEEPVVEGGRGRGWGGRAAAPACSGLSPSQVALVLWAVAQLGHQPPAAWLEAMVAVVVRRAQDLAPGDAVLAVRAVNALCQQQRQQHLELEQQQRQQRPQKRQKGGSSRRQVRRPMLVDANTTVGYLMDGSTFVFTTGHDCAVLTSTHHSLSGIGSGTTCGTISDAGHVYDVVPSDPLSQLVAGVAGRLSGASLYGTLRAMSLVHGVSYATLEDQVLTEVYGFKSLRLLQGIGKADPGGPEWA